MRVGPGPLRRVPPGGSPRHGGSSPRGGRSGSLFRHVTRTARGFRWRCSVTNRALLRGRLTASLVLCVVPGADGRGRQATTISSSSLRAVLDATRRTSRDAHPGCSHLHGPIRIGALQMKWLLLHGNALPRPGNHRPPATDLAAGAGRASRAGQPPRRGGPRVRRAISPPTPRPASPTTESAGRR